MQSCLHSDIDWKLQTMKLRVLLITQLQNKTTIFVKYLFLLGQSLKQRQVYSAFIYHLVMNQTEHDFQSLVPDFHHPEKKNFKTFMWLWAVHSC